MRINKNRFIVLWYYEGKVNYCETDSRGNRTSDIMSFEANLSDCQIVVNGDELVWYCFNNSETVFYTINIYDISKTQKYISVSGHDYSASSVNGTSVTLKCSKCSRTTTGNIPSSFELWWEDLSYSSSGMIYYNSVAESSYHPGTTVGLMVRYSSADLNDYEVISDKESVAEIVEGYDGFAVKAIKEGTAKITVRSKYNSEIKRVYTFKVAHNWQVKEKTEATCDKDGKTVKSCSVCAESDVQIIKASGHKMSEFKTVTEATCKSEGKKKSTCSVCGYYETTAIAKKDHDKKVSVEAVAPTCTKSGKTEGKKCSLCGSIVVAQQTVDALGHNLGKYKITKKPTCKAMGEETAECTRCTYTKTRDVERVPHTEVTVKAVAPTCTKSGKTAGKKCSVCDKVTVEPESISSLGHDLGEYEITKEATCSAKGVKTAVCNRCTYSKTAAIPMLEHKEVTLKAVKATCTKTGKTKGKKCSLCGKVTVAQKSTEALGHSKKTKVISKATEKANGKISTVCETCGKDYGETRVYRIQSVTLSSVK